jgi:hypothetical protein
MLAKNTNITAAAGTFVTSFKGNSTNFPAGWNKAVNRSMDKIDAQITQAGNLGGKTVVTITNALTNYIGKCYLTVTLTPGTYNATTMLPCFQDYLGYSLINKIRVRYGQNNCYELTGVQQKDFFHEERQWHEYRELTKVDVKGPLTESERRRLVKAGQPIELFIPIYLFWVNNSNQYHPQVLGANVEIDIEWAQSSDLLVDTSQTPIVGFTIATEPSIIAQKFRMDAIYVEPQEVSSLVSLASGLGIFNLTREFQTQIITQPGGQFLNVGINKVTLDVNKSINGGVVALYINLYRQQDILNNFKKRVYNRRGGKFDRYCRIKSFKLKSAGVEVRTPYSNDEMKHEMIMNRYNQGAVLSNIISVDFARLVDQVSTNTGQIDFSALNNLQLEMDVELFPNFETFIPYWEIRALTSNVVKIQKGTMQKIFF